MHDHALAQRGSVLAGIGADVEHHGTKVPAGSIMAFLNGSANRILRLFGIEPVEELASARSPQELLSLVQRSRSEGTLEGNTAKLHIRSFKFGSLSAADVMVPRRRVRTLSVDSSISDLVALARSTGPSSVSTAATIRST